MDFQERSLVEGVVSDLVQLREESNRADADNNDLRRLSALLRRLLVSGDYGKAWRAAGFEQQPRIPGLDLRPYVTDADRRHVTWAQAGGGRHEGTRVAPLIIYNRALSHLEIKARYQRLGGEPLIRYWHASEYLKSPCVVTKDLILDRRQLIHYVANKLGGVHFDPKRTGDDEIFLLLDHALETMTVTDKRAPYYEILSISQDVGHSRDASRLRERVTTQLGDVGPASSPGSS